MWVKGEKSCVRQKFTWELGRRAVVGLAERLRHEDRRGLYLARFMTLFRNKLL